MQALTISIVSHGHGQIIRELLSDLEVLLGAGAVIVVTLNIPESEQFLEGKRVAVIRNAKPKGFGANHNEAFRQFPGECFAVLNPDVRCEAGVFDVLTQLLHVEKVGVCGPVIKNPRGEIEDSARVFPSVRRIASRVISRFLRRRIKPDYALSCSGNIKVEWIAGMFMVFKRAAFQQVQGFDERYFMYLEDTDICYRLQRANWAVRVSCDVSAIHDARRATLKNARHLRWHLTSLVRFLLVARLVNRADPKRR